MFVFINGPLESLNHLFFDELVAQCMRDDCGIVTGMALDSANKIISTGFVRGAEDTLIDPYAGVQMPSHGYMGQISIVRSVEECSELFFAVRREHLAAVGGLGAISSSHMSHFLRLLSNHTRQSGLSTLYTPYAVASFLLNCVEQVERRAAPRPLSSFQFNPQLLTFDYSQQ